MGVGGENAAFKKRLQGWRILTTLGDSLLGTFENDDIIANILNLRNSPILTVFPGKQEKTSVCLGLLSCLRVEYLH